MESPEVGEFFRERGGLLPWFLVVPVQLAALFWELGVVAILTLPWWSIIASFALLDWALDWVFLLTLGLFCKPCAGLFIWVLNIAMLPIMLLGWVQRFFYESFGLIIDGWLLIFGFSGCFWKFGHHCWHTPRMKHRKLATFFDIPLLFSEPSIDNLKALILPPDIDSKEEFLQVRSAHRQTLLSFLPGYSRATTIYSLLKENLDF